MFPYSYLKCVTEESNKTEYVCFNMETLAPLGPI